MRRINGILREHVLEAPCSAKEAAAQAQMGVGGGQGREEGQGQGEGEGEGGDRRCWAKPFLVDIRYEKSTEQVRTY